MSEETAGALVALLLLAAVIGARIALVAVVYP